MQLHDMVLVSIDDHMIEPPDLFAWRAPPTRATTRSSIRRQRSRCDRSGRTDRHPQRPPAAAASRLGRPM